MKAAASPPPAPLPSNITHYPRYRPEIQKFWALRMFLLDETPSMAPLDCVRMIDGLGIITVDTSLPGFHHGDIGRSQLDWLA
jgi:hypothetical protein